jgi:hypothetical protein
MAFKKSNVMCQTDETKCTTTNTSDTFSQHETDKVDSLEKDAQCLYTKFHSEYQKSLVSAANTFIYTQGNEIYTISP